MTAVLREPERINLDGQDTGDRECLSHTRLGVFLACQQKFGWQYIERLEPAVKKPSLTMGAAFAHALEHGDPQAGHDMILEEQAALVEEHGGNPWLVVPTEQDAEVQAVTVRAAADAYLHRYGVTARREVTLRARVRNPRTGYPSQTFDVQARVDGLAGTTLIEDKLQAKVEAATERKLLLDRQVTLGAYLLWRCEGIEVDEVRYRITRKPTIKRTQKETHAEYLARVERDYRERPDFYLHEFPLTRTRDDFLRLELELWTWCAQIREARDNGVWPRNTAACLEYGGCPMLALCAQEPGAERQFVRRQEAATTRPAPTEVHTESDTKEIAA